MKFLSKLSKKELKGKTAILATDYNDENEKDSYRIEKSIPSIKYLNKTCEKVIILSHKKRFSPDFTDIERNALSLKNIAKILERKLGKKVLFINFKDFTRAKQIISEEKKAKIFLLENLRFFAEEEANDETFGRILSELGNIFINDAFSVSHRENASITQIPKFLPGSLGLLFESEIKHLNQIMSNPKKPFVIVLGGAKASDKLPIMEHLLDKVSFCLLGGVPANTFLKAQGVDIKASAYEESFLNKANDLLKTGKIVIPNDLVWKEDKIYDAGIKTSKDYANIISKAKTVLWNGPLGYFEEKKYMKGSEIVAKAIAKSKAFSVVGGGESSELVKELGLEKKFSFLSTGGGAMLEYLSGKKLPGIEALENTNP